MRKNRRGTLPSDLQLDLLLALFEGERGSADLAEVVGEMRRREVALATFYRQLHKAVDLGWVDTSDDDTGEPHSERDRRGPGKTHGRGPGRPQRRYGITDAGVRVLRTGLAEHERRLARAHDSGLLPERTP